MADASYFIDILGNYTSSGNNDVLSMYSTIFWFVVVALMVLGRVILIPDIESKLFRRIFDIGIIIVVLMFLVSLRWFINT